MNRPNFGLNGAAFSTSPPAASSSPMVFQSHEEPRRRRRTINRRRVGSISQVAPPSHRSYDPTALTPPQLKMENMRKRSSLVTPHYPRFRNPENRYIALDCEMVGVGPGGLKSALARVSIVDYYGRSLLDTFVKVREPVTDYRTNISGVRPTDLESPHALHFAACRRIVLKLINNKILVGHGLVNDLEILRIRHPWIHTRDTSTYDPFLNFDEHHYSSSGSSYPSGRPRRLKDLAQQHLGWMIQQEGQEHDSLTDARAAMELYKRVKTQFDLWMEWKRHNMMAQLAPALQGEPQGGVGVLKDVFTF